MNEPTPDIQPLPYKRRSYTFRFLLLLFIGVLPFLYLYATGYRLEFGKENTLVSTGGIYVSADKTNASIYVDEELVRETRTFRRAFYAQSLEPGTHRVHVQKDGSYTWVKELPVSPHIVTEAQAFNLPIVPQIRIISPWRSVNGATLLTASTTIVASTTNDIVVSTSTARLSRIADTEFATLARLFATTSATSTIGSIAGRVVDQLDSLFVASTTLALNTDVATSTKEWRGVKLHEGGEDIYATWLGSREDMPYYYCAEEFERLSTSTPDGLPGGELPLGAAVTTADEEVLEELVGPIQHIPEDVVCEPTIRIDRKWQQIKSFDFFPGSTDHVIVALEDGIYVVEIDDRAWQNVQPLLLGDGFDMRVENGNVYVYDGELIYHVLIEN